MNGPAYGGGAEIIFGCDMVFAAEGHCEVVFPEVLRGTSTFLSVLHHFRRALRQTTLREFGRSIELLLMYLCRLPPL